MTHWHYTRTKVQPVSTGAGLEMYFCQTSFSDVSDAAKALSVDVITRHPAAKNDDEFANILQQQMADYGPACAYMHKPNPDVIIQWRTRQCTGNTCSDTQQEYEREVVSHMIKKLDQPASATANPE